MRLWGFVKRAWHQWHDVHLAIATIGFFLPAGIGAVIGSYVAATAEAFRAYAPASWVFGGLLGAFLLTGISAFLKWRSTLGSAVDLTPINARIDSLTVAVASLERELQATHSVVSNCAALAWLDEGECRLELAVKSAEEFWQSVEKKFAEKDCPPVARMTAVSGYAYPHWVRANEDIKSVALKYLKLDVDVSSYARYLENPMRKVPGDEAVQDEAIKLDFRRCYVQRQTANAAVQQIRDKLQQEKCDRQRQLLEAGKAATLGG